MLVVIKVEMLLHYLVISKQISSLTGNIKIYLARHEKTLCTSLSEKLLLCIIFPHEIEVEMQLIKPAEPQSVLFLHLKTEIGENWS